MADNITTIIDPTIYIKPGDKLVGFLQKNSLLKNKKREIPNNIALIIKKKKALLTKFDIEWLNQLLSEKRMNNGDLLSKNELDLEINKILNKDYTNIEGINSSKKKNLPYLNELMKGSELILPKNEVVKRNPILAERVQKLKKEQEEREYKAMTKNVDLSKKFHPEDSIGYQMNMMNRHLIAVVQFLVSVGAGFTFGFLGIKLIIDDLDFGVRLILGIACALIIAAAEFYFLAKHLNEEDSNEMVRDKMHMPRVQKDIKIHKD